MDSTFPDTTSLTFNLTSHNAFKLPCSGRSTVEVVKGPNLSYNTCTCSLWLWKCENQCDVMILIKKLIEKIKGILPK